MAIQRSTPLTIAWIAIAIGSCLALIASTMLFSFLWGQYFTVYHFGIRNIDSLYYLLLFLIAFEVIGFFGGAVSAYFTLKGKQFVISVFGTTFLLLSGILFFANYLIIFPGYLKEITVYVLWSILQGFVGLPIIVLASIGLIFLISKKRLGKESE
jgi:hypothetical protein